ncbi:MULTISPECIES: acyltransferase [unclassified Pseudoalteromonas]|uniref:acyltransferase n=1 Tax=unclassified Pseudoalteromonas TaxID=194690 RepID=UPI00048B5AE0|nr:MULTISPECIES: acyltransferase [unclassified Pseudoalteromonas]
MKYVKKILIRPLINILTLYFYLTNLLILKFYNVEIGADFKINGKIFIRGRGKLIIANQVTINSSLQSNPVTGDSRTILVIHESAEVVIGNNTGISNSVIYSRESIVIGDNVMIGSGCKLYDTDFHSLDLSVRLMKSDMGLKQPIVISNGAFIGANSIVLKGVTIGENSVIGAGSVVSKSIPKNQVWAGNPIRFIREIEY